MRLKHRAGCLLSGGRGFMKRLFVIVLAVAALLPANAPGAKKIRVVATIPEVMTGGVPEARDYIR